MSKNNPTNYFFGYIGDEDIDLDSETAIGDGVTSGLIQDLIDANYDAFNVIDSTALGLSKEPSIKVTPDGEEDHTGAKEDKVEAIFNAIALTDSQRAIARAYKGRRKYFFLVDMKLGFVQKAGLLSVDVSIDATGNKKEVHTITGTETGDGNSLYETKTLTPYSGDDY